MADKKKKDAKGTLEQAKNWYADRYQFVVVQRNVLAIITLLALIVVGSLTFAVARIADSKTFEPYVIEVESKTGITTLVEGDSLQKYTANEMVVRYFINSYVSARESYDINNYQYDYNQLVRLFSAPPVFAAFYEKIRPESPESPMKMDASVTRKTKIKSITFLQPKKAQVRIQVDQEGAAGVAEKITKHYIITMDFEFFPLELSLQDRYINPLGFQVTSYKRDEDSVI